MRSHTVWAFMCLVLFAVFAYTANAGETSVLSLPGTTLEPQVSLPQVSEGDIDNSNDSLSFLKSLASLCLLDAEGARLVLALQRATNTKDDSIEKLYIQLVDQTRTQSEDLAENLVDTNDQIFDGLLRYIEYLGSRAPLAIPILLALEDGLGQAVIHDCNLRVRLQVVKALKGKFSACEWKPPAKNLIGYFAKWLDKRYRIAISEFKETKDRPKFARTRKWIHTGIDWWSRLHNRAESANKEDTVEQVFSNAMNAYSNGNYSEAINLYLKARSMDAVYCAEQGVCYQIALCYRGMSNFDKALEYLRESMGSDYEYYRWYSYNLTRSIFLYDFPDELATAFRHIEHFRTLAQAPPADWLELGNAAWYEVGDVYEKRVVSLSGTVEAKEQAYLDAIMAYKFFIEKFVLVEEPWFFATPPVVCWNVANVTCPDLADLFKNVNNDKYETYILESVSWFRRFRKDYPGGWGEEDGDWYKSSSKGAAAGDAQSRIFSAYFDQLGQYFFQKQQMERAKNHFLSAIPDGETFVREFHAGYTIGYYSVPPPLDITFRIGLCYSRLTSIHMIYVPDIVKFEEYTLQAIYWYREVIKIPAEQSHTYIHENARYNAATLLNTLTNQMLKGNPVKAEQYGTQAIAAFVDVIEHSHNDTYLVSSKLTIGQIHLTFKRYENAIAFFKKVISEHPGSSYCVNAQYNIGTCYFGLKEYDTAIVEFTRVKDNYPASSNVYMHGNAELGIGNCYFEKGEYRQATARYLNLIKTYGPVHSTYLQTGAYGLKRVVTLKISPRPASVPGGSSLTLNAAISYPNSGVSDLVASYTWKWEQTGETDAGVIVPANSSSGKNSSRNGTSSADAIFTAGNREGAMATIKVSVTFDAQTASLPSGTRALPVTIEDEISFSIGSDPGYGCGFFAWNTFARGTNLYSGNHMITAADLNISAPGLSLIQSRVYNSKADRAGLFGKGWQAWYEERLWPVKDSRGRTVSLVMTDSSGAKFDLTETTGKSRKSGKTDYDRENGQEFTAPAGMYFNVKSQFDGTYLLTDKNGMSKLFDGSGALYRVVDRNENVLEITWEQEGARGPRTLRAVRKIRLYNWKTPDSYRELILKTDADGRVTEAIDPLGRSALYGYSGGLLTSVNLPLGYREICSYDDKNRLKTRSLPGGYSESFDYDQSGRLITRTTPDGAEHFSLDTRSRQASVTDRAGQTSRYQLDNYGRLSSLVSPLDHASALVWDSSHNITAAKDALNKTATLTWDNLGNMTGVTDRTSAKTSLVWNPAFSVLSSFSDANGNTWAMDLDEFGNPTRISNPESGETRLTYETIPGLPVRIVDALGNSYTLKYDQYGYIISVTDPLAGATTITRDKAGRPVRIVDAMGGITDNTFNALGKLVVRHNPDGGFEYFTYDLLGNLLSYTDPDGSKTTYVRDSFGRLVETTDAANRKTSYGYDAEGRMTSVTDPAGRTRKLEYDAEGKVTAILYADGSRDAISYDAAGRPLGRKDPRENNWISSVDAEGRLTESIDPAGGTTRRSLDPVGNILSVKDSLDRAVNMSYTPLNEVKSITDPAGTTTFERDKLGRVTKSIDSLGNVTIHEYDPLGRLTAITDALSNKTEYVRDLLGRLKKITDARNNVRSFEFDSMSRLTQETDAQGNKRAYMWNKRGDLLTRTDALGRKTEYTRDPLGRATAIVYPDRTVEISYNLAGNVEKISANTISAEYVYDVRDRLIQTTWQPYGWIVKYEYDAAGNRTKMIVPEGGATRYKYDARNLLAHLTDPWDKEYLFEYDKTGMRTRKLMPDGTITKYNYDNAGRMEEIQAFSGSTPILSRKLTRDAIGNVLAIKEPSGTSNFTYDSLSRLTDASYSDGAREIYTYDEVGNRTKLTGVGVPPTTYIYDNADRLVSASTPDNRTNYDWDTEGNLVRKTKANTKTGRNDETQILEWDSENRLIKAFIQTEEATEIRYVYSPSGARIAKSVNGKRTYFCPDGEDVLATYEMTEGDSGETGKNSSGAETGRIKRHRALTLQSRFIHGPLTDEHLAMVTTATKTGRPETNYFHQDERGSVLGVTDPTGQIQGRWNERAFGERLAIQAFDTPYAFTGREYEPELGLSFHRNRYYDPSIGRFISRDPVFGNITNPITQHPYVYGNLSPYRYTDPDGRLAFGLIDAGEEDAKLLARHYATEYAREGGMLNLAKVAIYSPWSDDTASTITAGTVIVGGGALVYVGGAYAFAQAQAVIATAGTATTGMLEKFKQWLHGGKNVAYEAAQAGGKHAGTLKNYSDRSIAEIQKAISSYGDQVSLHQQKIANPAQFIERWAELPSSHQANILRKWASDAARNQELSDVLRGLWRSK